MVRQCHLIQGLSAHTACSWHRGIYEDAASKKKMQRGNIVILNSLGTKEEICKVVRGGLWSHVIHLMQIGIICYNWIQRNKKDHSLMLKSQGHIRLWKERVKKEHLMNRMDHRKPGVQEAQSGRKMSDQMNLWKQGNDMAIPLGDSQQQVNLP